ncbi:MAG: DUF2127 domain-containing protein [Deltaproteobacteria bacterium]|nr:DUF2127 domain-containing protein [Deltaproteobacteria bacterium]
MEREIKKEGFLRFIIAQKIATGALELVLSVGLLGLLNTDLNSMAMKVAVYFNLDTDNQYVKSLIEKAGMIGNGTILGISGSLFLLAALALTEGWGLYFRRRWAEWLTVISTSLFIPFEAYKVVEDASVIKVGTLVLNCAIVYYLAKHKELFRAWGKKKASSLS